MTTPNNQPYAIHCSTVWGGVEPISLDLRAKSLSASLHSTASGGDFYYMSVCSADVLTYMVVADVRGHGVQVSEISSWI
jgi:phosphoserine phosphatase RsbU/P